MLSAEAERWELIPELIQIFANGKRRFHSFLELYVIRSKNQGVKIWSKYHFQPFCFWGEQFKGLNNQADVELEMINAISAADIAFAMSSSQAIVNWLNVLDQSDFS